MNVEAFAKFVDGEVVAGAVITKVAGVRQYLYNDGRLTAWGMPLWQAWQDSLSRDTFEEDDQPKRRGRPRKEKDHG